MELNRNDEAITCFDRAHEINPSHVNAWHNKGRALLDIGRSDDAIACFNAALEIEPKHLGSLDGKGDVLRLRGDLQESVTLYNSALEIDPTFVPAWVGKGFALRGLGSKDEAVKCYDRALEIDPRCHDALIARARSNIGREEALKECDRTLVLDSQHEDAWTVKSIALLSLGRNQESLDCSNETIKRFPKSPEAWFCRALALSALEHESLADVLTCAAHAESLGLAGHAEEIKILRRSVSSDEKLDSFPLQPELLSNVVDKRVELGGGLIETNSIFEDDSLNEVGQ